MTITIMMGRQGLLPIRRTESPGDDGDHSLVMMMMMIMAIFQPGSRVEGGPRVGHCQGGRRGQP